MLMHPSHRKSVSALWLLSILLLILTLLFAFTPKILRIQTVTKFHSVEGRAWSTPIDSYGDDYIVGNTSDLVIMESGARLPIPHSTHADIIRHGAGRYSHWRKSVIFSTSDNSDPNNNGREYKFRYHVDYLPNSWVKILALLTGVSLALCSIFHASNRPLRLVFLASSVVCASLIVASLGQLYVLDINNMSYRPGDTFHDGTKDKSKNELLRTQTFSPNSGESVEAYFQRISNIVFDGSYHCEHDSYDLGFFSNIANQMRGYSDEVFSDFGILSRSYFQCGFCHQRAYVVASVLNKNGFSAIPYGLNGHVVTKAEHNGEVYYLDPDYRTDLIQFTDDPSFVQRLSKTYSTTPGVLPSGKVKEIIEFYATTSDNTPYNLEALEEVEKLQKRVFHDAKIYRLATIPLTVSIIYFLMFCTLCELSQLFLKRSAQTA